MTFGEVFCCTFWTMVADAWMPSGTGFAPRTSAAFRSASRSWPARFAISRAARSVTHASQAERRLPGHGGNRVLRAAPRRLHDLPAVGRGFVGVNQDGARRTLPRGFLELVRPAAVIGQRRAAKQLRLLGRRRRIVDHDQRDLPLHVDARVVVPVVFGRDDAVADEDELSGRPHLRLLHAAEADDVLEVPERRAGPALSVNDGSTTDSTIATCWK